MSAIAKIERVPLRQVWPHEAHHLTTWLEENLDVLDDAPGLGLASAERESAAGAFSVDLVAPGRGRPDGSHLDDDYRERPERHI